MNDTENTLREWAPLTDLFNRLPSKSQSGLFYHDVKLTCVDVLPEFIALGTNLGIAYWYDRKNKNLQRLRCENSSSAITQVKVISTVDFMVACGGSDGNISIFQIPKVHPDSLPENLKPKNKQVERYTVTELHKSAISALEWSKNGMKLFSGDKNGVVVLTEIDFYMHLCKSTEVLNESYEVVQLSYYQHNLLISTTYRSIICKKLDKWEISQVGKKDRKVLGKFGGIFYKTGPRISDMILYCTRPGLRIWISDMNGSVQQTLLFKDLLNKECWEVPIINPISESAKQLKPLREVSFGTLLPFNNDLLVTYGNDVVYILDPKQMNVLACVSSLRRVLSVATNKSEIFILEGERSLIRLSYRPECATENASTTSTSAYNNSFTPITSSIRDITAKLQTASIISAIPPLLEKSISGELTPNADSGSVVKAEEATESPTRLKKSPTSDSDNSPIYLHNVHKKFEIYDKIGEREFDDTILFKHHKRKKKRSDMSRSTTSLSSSSSDDRDNCVQPTVMNLSTVGILPDLRSPDSILNDIEYKEKILADVLNFDRVKISCVQLNGDEKVEKNSTDQEKMLESSKSSVVSSSSSKCIESNEIKDGSYKKMDLEESSLDDKNLPLINGCDVKAETSSNEVERSVDSVGEFCIKPFKHILPEFDKIKYEDSRAPDFLSIPNHWQLADIKLNTQETELSISDASLSEWEIL